MSVPVLLVLPADPDAMRIGGIASFIRGLVKFAPPDFEFGMIGVSSARQVGRWHHLSFEGRRLRFLPVVRADTTRRSRIPLALRFAIGGVRWRRRLATAGWIPSLHRPGSELLLSRHRGPIWRVVHLTTSDLTDAAGESRWRRLPVALDWLERRAFHRMERIYVVNREAAKRYRHIYPDIADRFTFLPNWVDDSIFSPVDDAIRRALRSDLAGRLDLPADAELALYAGRLEAQKDPQLIADAFAALLRRRPSIRLLIAGEGSMRASTDRRLQGHGVSAAVRFLGVLPRRELASVMTVSDVMLIASRYETGPTVGLEALASGLPVVTTPVGELSRILADGRGGRVVRTRSADEIALAADAVLARGGPCRSEAIAVAAPYGARRVLAELYRFQRELVGVSATRGAG